jgi:hypothetical protein
MQRQDFWSKFHRKFHWSLDKLGVIFDYKGDEVWWIYPWNHVGKKERFISLGFTGTGAFGDAVFKSLKDIDKEWESYFRELGTDDDV